MRNRNISVYFIPSAILLFSWTSVLFVRDFSLISFDDISFTSAVYLTIFFAAFLGGSLLGPLFFAKIEVTSEPQFAPRSVHNSANLILVFALLSIFLLVFKFISLIGGLSFSLTDITELRLSRGRDSGEAKGGTISGVLGMALSGFPIICYLYREYFLSQLSEKMKRNLYIVFFTGIFVSFLSGGRFAAAIALLIVFIVFALKKYKLFVRAGRSNSDIPVTSKKKKKKGGLPLKLAKLLLYGLILYIFSMIFIIKAVGDNDNLIILLDVLTNNFPGIEISYEHKEFLKDQPTLLPIYFVISLFQYYIGHAIYQFDVLYSAPYPTEAPYLLQYQFYLHTSLLRKIGLDFLPIEEILNQIENPGVYFTLAGAFFLDFGHWGAIFAIFFFAVLGSRYWVRFIRQGMFFDLYASILYLVFIIFSPIVAITVTGVFPSLLTIAFILKLYLPKKIRNTPKT